MGQTAEVPPVEGEWRVAWGQTDEECPIWKGPLHGKTVDFRRFFGPFRGKIYDGARFIGLSY